MRLLTSCLDGLYVLGLTRALAATIQEASQTLAIKRGMDDRATARRPRLFYHHRYSRWLVNKHSQRTGETTMLSACGWTF